MDQSFIDSEVYKNSRPDTMGDLGESIGAEKKLFADRAGNRTAFKLRQSTR
jgi:hypothetical protein